MSTITNFKATVKNIMETIPYTRESYSATYHYVLAHLGYDSNKMSVHELLSLIDTKRLPSFETIHRVRRLLLEQNEYLRGKNYGECKKEEQSVKKEMTYEKRNHAPTKT